MRYNRSNEIDIDRQPTPGEIDETRPAGRELNVTVPRLQALYTSIAVASILPAFLFTVAAWGRMALFALWFIVGAATFLWWIWCAARTVKIGDDGSERMGVDLRDVLTGAAVTLFVGFLAWCLWTVVDWLTPGVSLPEWMAWALPIWQHVAPVASAMSLIFAVWNWLHLEVSLLQRLLMPLTMQETYIWRALGSLLEHWGKREKLPEARPLPQKTTRIELVLKDERGNTRAIKQDKIPLPPDKVRMLADHIVIQGKPLSEPALCGNGAGILTQPEFVAMRDWLFERGFAWWVKPENHKLGIAMSSGIKPLLRPFLSTAPPHAPDNGSEGVRMNENERTNANEGGELG